MKKKLLRFDWAIKNIFKKGRDLEVLQGFLSELLQKNLTTISLCESESTKDHENDKSNKVDVHVTVDNGEKIIIEVQAQSERDYFRRTIYGTSKVITNHIHKVDPYYIVPNVVSVNICYFGVGEGKDYLYKGTTSFIGQNYGDRLFLNKSEKERYIGRSDTLEDIYPVYYIIRVDKFNEVIEHPTDEWVYFF